ncbi:hypothetical protein BJX62DRAFT_244233 [Aspergillus germanicus]
MTSEFLLALLNAPRRDRSDVHDILSQRSLMFPASVRRSESALSTYEFRRWITQAYSQTLLIEGDQNSDGSPVSAVSPISALVYVATKDRKAHIPLFWSCSLHDGDNEDTDRAHGLKGVEERQAGLTPSKRLGPNNTGPRAMIAAFIVQLLQQHLFNFSSMLHEHHLPNLDLGITLFFLLDDVGHLEGNTLSQNGEEDGLLMLLKTLFRLAADKQLACVIRLLVTSADLTDEVADLFAAHHGLVVDFGSLDEGDGFEECYIGDLQGFEGEHESDGD